MYLVSQPKAKRFLDFESRFARTASGRSIAKKCWVASRSLPNVPSDEQAGKGAPGADNPFGFLLVCDAMFATNEKRRLRAL